MLQIEEGMTVVSKLCVVHLRKMKINERERQEKGSCFAGICEVLVTETLRFELIILMLSLQLMSDPRSNLNMVVVYNVTKQKLNYHHSLRPTVMFYHCIPVP